MLVVLSGILAGAVCVGIATAIAYCFPSKEMLDAEAVERERSVTDDREPQR